MAVVADFHPDFFFGGADRECIPARAGNLRVRIVGWMGVFFHIEEMIAQSTDFVHYN